MDVYDYLEIEKSQKGLRDKFKSLKSLQLEWYESEALSLFKLKRFPSRNNDQLIQQAFGKSPKDVENKRDKKDYYIANSIAYLQVARSLLTEDFVQRFSETYEIDDLIIYNYHELFRGFLIDSLVLLNEYAELVQGITPPYMVGKNNSQHTLTIYQSLKQSIFGQCSYHSFIDIEPNLSILMIRQLIELRIRRAFGVLGWLNSATNSVEPIALSMVLEVLKMYEANLDLSVPLSSIIRINGWSNIFIHSGVKDYSWKPILVKDYLKEFALGKRNKHSVCSGISASQSTLQQIVSDLEIRVPKEGEVYRCKPELEIID